MWPERPLLARVDPPIEGGRELVGAAPAASAEADAFANVRLKLA